MTMYDIIAKKRDKLKLTKEEIEYFVRNYSNDTIPDYQASALLMAIYLNGMDMDEITNLTIAMANSSDKYDLSEIGKCIVDKHSTGGVGDKVTLIVLPIVASLGVPVAKMSGRGLGFTGGTIDKLESIEGFSTSIPYNQFISQVKDIGMALIGQSKDIVVADKKLYALRDTTATVSSNALIASSIMSKKIAAGADKIVLDVTCGSGAFMKNLDDAKELAKIMVAIGKIAQKETVAVITDMDEPLGNKIGNRLEIEEVIDFLTSDTLDKFDSLPNDLKEVVLTIGSYMLKLSGLGENLEENKEKMIKCILKQDAYKMFLTFIVAQGGKVDKNKGEITLKSGVEKVYEFKASRNGYLTKINGELIGLALVALGGGRNKKEDDIDFGVGFEFKRKTGNYVKKDDLICKVMYNDDIKLKKAMSYINSGIIIEEKNIIGKINDNILDVIE